MTQPSGQTLLDCITESIRDPKRRGLTQCPLSANNASPGGKLNICEGSSTTQVSAIADNIREQLLERQGIKPYGYDGYETAQWIVIDYGDTLVHVFQPATRRLYNLEELWSDAKITNLPDLD